MLEIVCPHKPPRHDRAAQASRDGRERRRQRNPAELLGSEEMRKLLNILSEKFNHIIIDSPPAISFTDASILSTMVDGVILVVHGGRSSRAVVRRAKQQLLDVGAHVFGVVLNNVKVDARDDYYYSRYHSHYYESDADADQRAGETA